MRVGVPSKVPSKIPLKPTLGALLRVVLRGPLRRPSRIPSSVHLRVRLRAPLSKNDCAPVRCRLPRTFRHRGTVGLDNWNRVSLKESIRATTRAIIKI